MDSVLNPEQPSIPGLKRRALVLITLLLIGLLALMLLPGYLQQPDATSIHLPAQPCDLHTGPCEAVLGERRVTLSLSPGPLQSMQPIHVEVALAGIEAQGVLLDLQGLDMYMGINQTLLQPAASGQWQGQTEIAVCATGKMTWRAQLTIVDSHNSYTTWFDFDAH